MMDMVLLLLARLLIAREKMTLACLHRMLNLFILRLEDLLHLWTWC